MVHPPREHSDRLDYTKRLLTQLMLWVEHYNACVERKSRELPRDVWSHSFTFLSVEFEEAAESSAEDIQKVRMATDCSKILPSENFLHDSDDARNW